MTIGIVVGTSPLSEKRAIYTGILQLREGKTAVDAVEAAINVIENDPEETSVGYGGSLNLIGEVELDASIMNGVNLAAGAVSSIKNYKNPISIARKVMEVTPHVQLTGEGAGKFAEALGFKKKCLITEKSREKYIIARDGFLSESGVLRDNFRSAEARWFSRYESIAKLGDVKDIIEKGCIGYLQQWYKRLNPVNYGTCNFMALDSKNNICCGVSTSGPSLKLPGRVGDSPTIGAGNYCDIKGGAVGCRGVGEVAMRLLTAKSVVDYMKTDFTVREACEKGIRDIIEVGLDGIRIQAMDNKGEAWSAWDKKYSSFAGERIPTYYWMSEDMAEPELKKGSLVTR